MGHIAVNPLPLRTGVIEAGNRNNIPGIVLPTVATPVTALPNSNTGEIGYRSDTQQTKSNQNCIWSEFLTIKNF